MNVAAIPEKVGPYRIQSKLGQGGMGAVYLGLHETLERPAAVKLLPVEFTQNPELVERFLREARVVAGLRHQHIVQVYDAGACDGRYYIAMEYIEGCSLAKRLQDVSSLSEEAALELMEQAAQGLSAAHAKGLIHRDVKPENLLLDEEGVLHVVDFGLVMEAASSSHLTSSGAFVGTPAYMSPEQADGEKADPRTDLYSLGVTFYRAVTGTAPFASDSVMNLLFKHKFEPPPDPHIFKPDLSDNMCNLLLTLMAKRREDRPESAQKVVELIGQMRQGRKIPAAPAFRPLAAGPLEAADETRPASAPRRKGTSLLFWGLLLGGAAAVLLVAVLAIGGAWYYMNHREAEGPPAVTPLPGSLPGGSAQTSRADPMSATAPGVPSSPGGPPRGEDAAARFGKLSADAQALLTAGDTGKALACCREAEQLGLTGAPAEKLHDLTHQALVGEALRLEREGRFDLALQRAEEAHALKNSRELVERIRHSAELAGVRAAAAAAEKESRWGAAAGQYEAAVRLASDKDTQAALQKRAGECRLKEALAEADQAAQKEDWDAAAAAWGRALALKDDPETQSRRQVALQRAAAERDYRAAVAAGAAALAAGNLEEARAQYQRAGQLNPAGAAGAQGLQLVEAHTALARAQAARLRGDWAAARTEYENAAKLAPASLQPDIKTRTAELDSESKLAEQQTADAGKFVRDGRAGEALTRVSAALQAYPRHPTLPLLRQSLEAVQKGERLVTALQESGKKGRTAAGLVKEVRSDDGTAADVNEYLDRFDKQVAEQQTVLRARFLAQRYADVAKSMPDFQALARGLADELAGAQDAVQKKAKDEAGFTGVKVGFIKIGKSGNKEKAEKLAKAAEAFGTAADEARKLGQ